MGDFERVARHVTGHARGLVLSGGGARGLAHLGVFKTMEELRIPIGTSALQHRCLDCSLIHLR